MRCKRQAKPRRLRKYGMPWAITSTLLLRSLPVQGRLRSLKVKPANMNMQQGDQSRSSHSLVLMATKQTVRLLRAALATTKLLNCPTSHIASFDECQQADEQGHRGPVIHKSSSTSGCGVMGARRVAAARLRVVACGIVDEFQLHSS